MKTFKLFILSLCCGLSIAHAEQGEFRGYVDVEQMLTERMLAEGQFTFRRYFADLGYFDARALLLLLGGYNEGGPSSFQNGHPNSVNMLLWNLLAHLLAEDIQKTCAQTSFPYNNSFRQALEGLCQWPNVASKNSAAMERYWLALMSYEAPEAEFKAWRDFFLNSSYTNKPATEAVHAMTFAILMNPYFLLRR